MPIGFAKNILTTSAVSSATNTFTGWDGSNDTTLTRGGDWNSIIGFAPFSDEYGLLVTAKDGGGIGAVDSVVYDLIRNNNGTLSVTSGNNNIVTTSNSNYVEQSGLVAPTQTGTILVDLLSVGNSNNAFMFSLSGTTVTKGTGFAAPRETYSKNIFVARSGDSTGYNNIDLTKRGQKVTLNEVSLNSTTLVTSTESVLTDTMHYANSTIPGFVDNDTPFFFQSTDGSELLPMKLDLGTTGNQSGTTFAGVSASTMDLETANNRSEFVRFATPTFNDVAFNDTALFFERAGGTPNNKYQIHSYKAGDSAVKKSNILTLSSGDTSDSSFTGCFVGPTNDVFLFGHYQVSGTQIKIMKFVLSTNTVSEVLDIDITLGYEQLRLMRWGNNGAILAYDTDKIRLIRA